MGLHVHAQELNVPAIAQDVNRSEILSCKKSTDRRIHAQDRTVPAVAQDINVPDVVVFDLACTM